MKYVWRSVRATLLRNIVIFVTIFFLVGWYRSGQMEYSLYKAVFSTTILIPLGIGARVLVENWEMGRKAKRLLVSKDEIGFARYVLRYSPDKFYSETFKEDLDRDVEAAIQAMKKSKLDQTNKEE